MEKELGADFRQNITNTFMDPGYEKLNKNEFIDSDEIE
jgi:hypothetical protein